MHRFVVVFVYVPSPHETGKLFSSGAEDLGWNGTGEVYPIVRVTLLHKSDGTASAPDTKLGTSGLRVSCINGGWALPCHLTVDGMILGDREPKRCNWQ